jgi:hypothetical protein
MVATNVGKNLFYRDKQLPNSLNEIWKKLSINRFFSFASIVVDTTGQPLDANISRISEKVEDSRKNLLGDAPHPLFPFPSLFPLQRM